MYEPPAYYLTTGNSHFAIELTYDPVGLNTWLFEIFTDFLIIMNYIKLAII
jgi:hypothetical protein